MRPIIRGEGAPDIPGDLRLFAAFPALDVAGRGRYDVELELAERLGFWECVGISVRSSDRARRVDGDILRRLRVADLVRAAAAELEDSGWAAWVEQSAVPPRLGAPVGYVDRFTGEYVPPPMSADEHAAAVARRETEVVAPARAAAARWRRMVREAARAGGQTRLEAAAAIYKRAVRRGEHPTRAVARELGITANAASALVRRCRKADPPLLPPTMPGVVNAAEPPRRPDHARK